VCIVVRGIGANLHGAQRATKDFDLVARFERENLRRLAAAMRELGAYTRTEGYVDDATLEASKHLVHEDHLARMEITTWDSDGGPFDVLRNIPAGDGERLPYDELVPRSSEVVHAGTGLVVRIASLDDIVASKEWANRGKDHEALPELYRLQGRGGDGPEPAARPVESGPRPDRGPGGRTLSNGLDHPGGPHKRPPDRGIER